MAPKRGGSSSYGSNSSSSSSSSGCDACNTEYLLYNGDTWSDTFPRAYIAFLVLGLVAMFVALICATKSRWRRKGKIDTLREILFPAGIVCIILFFICEIVNTALSASVVTVTYIYLILYIFESLFFRIGDIVVAFVIYRAAREYLCLEAVAQPSNFPSQARTPMSAFDAPFRIISIVAIVALTILSMAAFGTYTASLAKQMIETDNYYYGDYEDTYGTYYRLSFTYYLIYVFWSLFLAVFVALKLKGRSRAIIAYILLIVAAIALAVYNLVSTISVGKTAFGKLGDNGKTYKAASIITVITYIVFILALIALSLDKIRYKGVVDPSTGPNSAFVGNGNGAYNDNMYNNNANGAGNVPQMQQPMQQQQYPPQPMTHELPNKYTTQQAPSELSGTSNPTPSTGHTPYAVPQGQPQQHFTPSPPPVQQQQMIQQPQYNAAPVQHQYPVPQQPQVQSTSPPPQQLYTAPPPQGYAQQPQPFSHQ